MDADRPVPVTQLEELFRRGFVKTMSPDILVADVASTTWASAGDMRPVEDESSLLRDKVRLLEEMISALVEENKRLTRLLEASPTFCPNCGKK